MSSASPPTRDKINGEEKARSRRRDTWADSGTSPPDDGNVILRYSFTRNESESVPDISRTRDRINFDDVVT